MGEFFGLPNLFTRTYEFFKRSLIYYNGRRELIRWKNFGSSLQVEEYEYSPAWNIHPGGLEGVRDRKDRR